VLATWEYARVERASASAEEAAFASSALAGAVHADQAALAREDALAAAQLDAPSGARTLLVSSNGSWRASGGAAGSDADLQRLVGANLSGVASERDPVTRAPAQLAWARAPAAGAVVVYARTPAARTSTDTLAFLAVLAFVALGAGCLAVVLSARVVGPIRDLERAAAAVDGDAPVALPAPRGAREVRSLRASIERMSDRLQRLSRGRARSLAETRADLAAVDFTLAHELREPLRSVRTLADLVARDGAPEELRETLGLVGAKAARLERLVTELERYDEIARRRDLRVEDVDLRALAEEASARVRTEHAHDVRIGDVPRVVGSRDLLAESMMEIVQNAAQHGARELRVSGRKEDGCAVVTFDDDGPGIPASRREDAFHLFQRLRPGTLGTGVGLAIVRRVASRHDGSASIDASPAGGTRVTLRLPLAGPAPRPSADEEPVARRRF